MKMVVMRLLIFICFVLNGSVSLASSGKQSADDILLESEARGLIRAATKEDADIWADMYFKRTGKKSTLPAGRFGSSPELYLKAFVVLSNDFVMTGAPVIYYIPAEVDIPAGSLGGGYMYRQKDGTCFSSAPKAGCTWYRPVFADNGIRQALNQGLIAPASISDIISWQEKYGGVPLSSARKTIIQQDHDQMPSTSRPGQSCAFVVLSDDFVLPEGLSGTDAVHLYVPPGVKAPKAKRGHSTIFYLKSGLCDGSDPRCH